MAMVTRMDRFKSFWLGYAGAHIGWQKDKKRIKDLYPSIDFSVFRLQLGFEIDLLSDHITTVQNHSKLDGKPAPREEIEQMERHRAAILDITAHYRAICNYEMANLALSADVREGWKELRDGALARVEGKMKSISFDL